MIGRLYNKMRKDEERDREQGDRIAKIRAGTEQKMRELEILWQHDVIDHEVRCECGWISMARAPRNYAGRFKCSSCDMVIYS